MEVPYSKLDKFKFKKGYVCSDTSTNCFTRNCFHEVDVVHKLHTNIT